MDLEQGLLTRRSVRKFIKNRSIPSKDVKEILEMAMYAPSGRDCQSWEFITIDDKSIFKEIMAIHPYSAHLVEASLAILVCGNTKEQMGNDYWVVDCTAATENLLLACHSRGLGSCWCGIYPDENRMRDFVRLFELPAHIRPLSLIVVGYPSTEVQQPKNRFKADKIHHNKW